MALPLSKIASIEHLLTAPRGPTATGEIERFHRSLRTEFLSAPIPFTNLKSAQQAVDEWNDYYNNTRPHQALDLATPAEKLATGPITTPRSASTTTHEKRVGEGRCRGENPWRAH
jgi:transposase InsO family protein